MNWDYVAGFFDGEGTIYYRLSKTQNGYGYQVDAHFRISQKDKTILEEIKTFLNVGVVAGDKKIVSQNIKWTQRAHALNVQGNISLAYLTNQLYDRVIVKKKQLILLKEYLSIKKVYNYIPIPKNKMLRIIEIARENSLASVKPNMKYQEKLRIATEDIIASEWTEAIHHQRLSNNSKIGNKIRKENIQRIFEEAINTVNKQPDSLPEVLKKSKNNLSNKAYLELRQILLKKVLLVA